jgi:hypothetical protein
MTPKRIAIVASVSAVLFAAVGMEIIRYANDHKAPLGQARPIQFKPDGLPQTAKQEFLNGDFTITKDVNVLPSSVLETLTEQGGSRLIMANPGEKFEATDNIIDSSLPQRRLIFAGVLSDRCFIHYERGGIAHSHIMTFFRLTSASDMEPLWSGYCDGPAAAVNELRSKLANGECSTPSDSL